jgi:exopolyphosphatase/guanosine-5'-triphosphate,3'-diphosphate pyrophosphatase
LKRAGREPAGFPLRVAGIDVGSNAMRLIAAEFTSPSTWTVLAEQRVAVRLGAAVFGADGGRLDAAVMEAALETLLSFRQRMDELGVVLYRAAATSAVREAANGSAFVQRALKHAGIVLDTITAGEEARLVWLAVASRIDVADERWILVDLGGGSVEIALAESDAVLWSESHAMGAVRMLAEFADAVATPRRFRRLAGEYIDTLMSRMALDASPGGGLVATGGNIEELARMSRAKSRNDVARLAVTDLSDTIDQLADLTAAQRIEQFGLRPDRADVVLPAALVYERIAHLARVDEIIVPGVGLKDGLLLDAMQNAVHDAGHSLRQERDIGTGAIALGRRYLFDEAHARHVAALALSLFDQLEELHDLDEHDRRLLLAAALLHDIGQFISYRRHHKHSFYLIQHASLPDLTSNDILLVALVARYHRRADPSREHDEFRDLKDAEQERVTLMAALLRVADALDRQHRQHVTDVTARVVGDVLQLEVTARGDVELEEWALEKKARLIARVLDLDIELHTSDAGRPE